MKHPWIVYVIVALLSIGAGVAIAGLPTDTPNDPTIIPPTTTTTVATATTTTTPVFVPTTDADPDPTFPTEGTDPTDSTTSTIAVVDPTSSTTDLSTTTTTIALPDRSAVSLVVVNGAGEGGLAADSATILQGIGWSNIRATTGLQVVDATTVYYAEGFEASAAQLATDLGLPAEAIAPIALAPPAEDVGLTQLIAYLGTDRVS